MEERWREPAALAEQYAGMLYRLAYARTGSRADAEDVMQEVFVRLLRARPEFRDEEHAKAWLLRVGAHCAADVLRAPWRRREGPLDDALPAPGPPGRRALLQHAVEPLHRRRAGPQPVHLPPIVVLKHRRPPSNTAAAAPGPGTAWT